MSNEARNYQARRLLGVVKPFKSLNAQVTTGGGTALPLPHPIREFTVQLNKLVPSTAHGTTHGSTKAVVRLQGKISTGSTWFNLGAAINITSSASVLARSTNAKAVAFARLSITSYTTITSSTPTSTLPLSKNNVTGYISPAVLI